MEIDRWPRSTEVEQIKQDKDFKLKGLLDNLTVLNEIQLTIAFHVVKMVWAKKDSLV